MLNYFVIFCFYIKSGPVSIINFWYMYYIPSIICNHLLKLTISVKVALCATEGKWREKNLKFKITVYYVTSVHRFILNIVSTKL